MTTSSSIIDELVRDYGHYRNLPSSLRVFEQELSKSSLGRWRADLIVEKLTLLIQQFDLNNLIDYWTQIEQRFLPIYTECDRSPTDIFMKTRLHLYRCYLIHAVQSSKADKIDEFFDRLTKTLQQSNDWSKEWFALPFLSNPEESTVFRVYFSKQWNELFWRSLQNFLAISIYHMLSPRIGTFDEDESATNRNSFGSSKSATSSGVMTIEKKLRNRFSVESQQQETPTFTLTDSSPRTIMTRPIQRSNTGNQILLAKDD